MIFGELSKSSLHKTFYRCTVHIFRHRKLDTIPGEKNTPTVQRTGDARITRTEQNAGANRRLSAIGGEEPTIRSDLSRLIELQLILAGNSYPLGIL